MKRFAIGLCVATLVGLASAASQAAVQFSFDPTDFFNYSAPSADNTRGLDGGMFRVHETWGGNMISSWKLHDPLGGGCVCGRAG